MVTASYVIPATHKQRIEDIASRQDRSTSALVRRILAEFLAREQAHETEQVLADFAPVRDPA